jgi:hypothetical protein
VRVILYWAGRVHWVVELLITLLLAGLLVILLLGVREDALARMQEKQPKRVILGILLVLMFLAIAVFSALSFLLWKWHPESYAGTTIYTPGKFADFYFWLLVDELPGLKIPATYGIPAPLSTASVLAATLVLAFRLFVIVRLLDAGRIWFRLRTPKVAAVSSR